MFRVRAKWLLAVVSSTLVGFVPLLSTPGRPVVARAAELPERPRFDPDLIRARPGSALEAALLARARGDRETARALCSAALASPERKPDEEPLLRYIAAQGARAADASEEAAELLFPVALSDHPLASWAKLQVAEWLELKDPGRALALLDILLVPSSELETWPGKVSAERLRARVLGKIGRPEESILAFERLLEKSADEVGAIQVLMPLAELLSTRSEPERIRALGLYRKVAARVPDTRVGKRAEEQVSVLLATLPEVSARALREPALEEQLLRAESLLAALKHKEALAVLTQLEPRLGNEPQLLCRARFGHAKALLDSRARTEGAALMASVASECPYDSEQRAWARYHAGRAFSALGKNEQAIEQYEALEHEAPRHRLADDALFRAARVAHDMGDAAGMVERLKALPLRYPHGDMQARARFSLAFQAAADNDLTTAINILAEDDRDEQTEDLQGRASYFRGRFLARQKRFDEAEEAFVQTVRRYPLSYYGMSAYSRLAQLDPARAHALAPRLVNDAAEKLTFEQRPELLTPGFQRAIALFSAGDVTLAQAELRALGFLDATQLPELTWLAAALLDRAGAPHLAVDMVRRRMPELLARHPVGRGLSLYRLVYPQAFAPLIEDGAAREGVPAAFVRAVAREESGFYPKAVSRSGARGLIQLLESTAKAVSKGGLNLPTHPAALQEPAINLALGTHFIATLASSVGGQMALVPAAYNAGPAATARWLSQRGHEPLDVWVENIPYDETRGYTRRVVQSYGVYHWLQTGEMLPLPERLPGSRPVTAAAGSVIAEGGS